MKQLGIYVALDEPLAHCRWVLAEAGRPALEGTGVPDAEVCRAARVRVTVAAASVLLVATRLPPGARRQSDEILTYAVEDRLLGDPDAQQASWLGRVAGDDVLAVMDKAALAALTGALARVGIENPVIECETLMLPRATGEWSVWWDGCSGYVRTTTLEGAVLDEGRANCPPLTLRLLVQSALARGMAPATLALYCAPAVALPELALWQRELGLPLRAAGVWDWRQAPAAIPLVRGARLWAGLGARLRLPALLVAAALGLHTMALLADWAWLRTEEQALHRQMEARFRVAVPEALAVVDPVLQMRRKLAEARRLAGVADRADFLPMLEQLAVAMKALPSADVRSISYAGGRLIVVVRGIDEAAAQQLVHRLRQDDLRLEALPTPAAAAGGGYQFTVQAP